MKQNNRDLRVFIMHLRYCV